MAQKRHAACPTAVVLTALIAGLVFAATAVHAQGDGTIEIDGQPRFPLGFYELPGSDKALKEMAESGVNLVRCGDSESLDRAAAVGMKGWIPLGVQGGATEDLRKRIESVKDHPALAVWEGPDEIIWIFTAYSVLYRTHHIYEHKDEWWMQTPLVYDYSEKKGAEILRELREGIALVRELDSRNLHFWINEAVTSDLKWVREYVDQVDIVGCDYYPVKEKFREVEKLGPVTGRWVQVGRDKPVYMVLQAFSYHELGEEGTFYWGKETYASFDENRLSAYICIAYGADGILYWGSSEKKTAKDFRQSVYAVTSELDALQPLLVARDVEGVAARVIEGKTERGEPWPRDALGVRCVARRTGREWLVILVNEDDRPHHGVEVSGLDHLKGETLDLLYGIETATINKHGELLTRMKPHEVKVFATGREWETDRRKGRDYPGVFVE